MSEVILSKLLIINSHIPKSYDVDIPKHLPNFSHSPSKNLTLFPIMLVTSKPIVVVTGANGGVGFGICQRLLFQLCQAHPSDALPQSFSPRTQDEDINNSITYDGITLIMACRSTKRAETARKDLYQSLDKHVEMLRALPNYDGHAQKFRKNVDIQISYLDLASISTVLRFSTEMSLKHPYISHVIFNAGVASFSHIHWPDCIRQLLSSPMDAITAPTFYVQHKGEMSVDGLGWVWQCNLFGHFALFRAVESLLAASPIGGRVIWSSSLEASPKFYDSEDWQLKETEHSYESSKYQIDLVAITLDRYAAANSIKPIRHFISHPGVCSTNVSAALVNPVLDVLKVMLFYIGRFFGSPHHTIQPVKAAIAAVHLSLAPLIFITFASGFTSTNGKHSDANLGLKPVRFGAGTSRWGEEMVGLSDVKDWDKHAAEGEELVKKCNALFESLKSEESTRVDSETASERM
ncbi:hypothetical protein BDQ17DRAFT_1354559 [Cyathus striatus]|nr:hypothetical protein BDQ17DRAFT_1354559 [Cyathus striatus]